MMLTKMRLENFKSWKTLPLDLSNITLLFGVNSSGKSSALQALLLLKQTAMGFDRSLPINLDSRKFGNYETIVFNHQLDRNVRIRLKWLPNRKTPPVTGDSVTYDVTWRQVQDSVVVDELQYYISEQDIEYSLRLKRYSENQYSYDFDLPETLAIIPTQLELFPSEPESTVPIESCYWVPRSVRSKDGKSFYVNYFNRAFEALIRQIKYLGPLRSYPERTYLFRGLPLRDVGQRGERTIDALLVSKMIDKVSEWLKKLGLVSEFQLKPIDGMKRFYEPRVKVGSEQTDNSLIDVGFGISQVLPVITQLFAVPEHSIVLLEQPELHLHPSAQAGLADLFLEVAEKRHLQLIIESHSEHLLARLQRRIAESENAFASPEHIKMYFCEPGQDGATIQPVEVDRFGQIANWPQNFFGDISGDLEAMSRAGLKRRKEELAGAHQKRES